MLAAIVCLGLAAGAVDEVRVAAAWAALAADRANQGRVAEAEALYGRAVVGLEKILGPEHPEVAATVNNLAGLYFRQGRLEEAERLFRRAQQIWEKTRPPHHPDVTLVLSNLATLYGVWVDRGRPRRCSSGRWPFAKAAWARIIPTSPPP